MLVHLTIVIVLVSSASGLISLCAPDENLVKTLQAVHLTPSYNHLDASQKVLISEMLSSVQTCQLTSYINTVGFSKVLVLLDSLTPAEAHVLNGYLVRHLNVEHMVMDKLSHTTTPRAHHVH